MNINFNEIPAAWQKQAAEIDQEAHHQNPYDLDFEYIQNLHLGTKQQTNTNNTCPGTGCTCQVTDNNCHVTQNSCQASQCC